MRKIYAIGESLLDIIFREDQPQTAKAGGSMLNSVVSLGRMKLPVSFISEYGYDDVGNLIDKFLKENGVDTSFVHRYNDGNTSLALAFLNEKWKLGIVNSPLYKVWDKANKTEDQCIVEVLRCELESVKGILEIFKPAN